MRPFSESDLYYPTETGSLIWISYRGWDQTGSAGANLDWPKAFGLDTDANSNDVWIFGLVNAAPYFASAFL